MTDLKIVLPRALRQLSKEAAWPINKEGNAIYSRAYRFAPLYKESESAQFALLLDAIHNIQDNDQSCIIFWNTVDECNGFFAYLKANGINTQSIQILDDTHDDEKTVQDHAFRPSEATVITRAKEPKMITLTTAAGGWGTDFDDITVGILVKPSSGRVTLQKMGRLARNMQFGLVYEIYNLADVDGKLLDKGSIFAVNKDSKKQNDNELIEHRHLISAYEAAMEEQTLDAIEHRSKTYG